MKYPNAGGGLALLWKGDVQLNVINYTANHILAKVVEEDGLVWFFTRLYGWPEAGQKVKSWALLRHLRTLVDGPWVCIGDFNAILQSTEKLSKRPPQHSQMDAFREALDHCQLEDLGFSDYQFTWNNKRPGEANTRLRLDRATADWRTKFPLSTMTHLSSHASDHLPIILIVQSSKKSWYKGQKSFKFEEAWLLFGDYEEVIKDAWEKGGAEDTGLGVVKQKVAACASDLQAWGSSKA